MKSEFDGHFKRVMEQLLQQVEEMGRRQEALEALTQRIMAEQEELRRRQDAQSQEWENFGRRWRAYFADWEVRLGAQTQQLEGFTRQLTDWEAHLEAQLEQLGGFTRQLTDWEARLNTQLQVLDELTKQFTDLLPPEEF
jgi:chromosome segregation ATPase